MSEAVGSTRQVILDTLADSPAFRAIGDDLFVVKQGSAIVMIAIHPWDKDRAVVRCAAQVVQGARFDQTLATQLLRLNAHLRFGAFAYLPEENVVLFLHSILGGATLDPAELSATVRDVALVADEYDDLIVERFGGKRMQDLVEEEALRRVMLEHPSAFQA